MVGLLRGLPARGALRGRRDRDGARAGSRRVAHERGRAGERARPADARRLARLVDLMDAVRDHDDEVLRVGAQFHGEIEALADNRWCSALLRQIRGHVDRYRALVAGRRAGTTDHVDEHRAVADAVAAGDPAAAEAAMTAHIHRSAALAEQALRDAETS
ncbi:FCD domain-containing protein [Cellulosimicrobium cellulans]|uniref:FCD domain-containing protein n=1 Tax=Cellulosimicrobium cellulans TaxID=1710 RepID=UPI0014960EF3|nr:FCD domain-containing protein [Cellulosimicrobium cellulans]